MRRAAIDVGSNSLILLVSECAGGVWVPLLERTKVTGLGRGTRTTGVLSESSITDSLAILRSMFDDALSFGVEDVFAGATMAVRIATNGPAFLARCEEQGTPVRILSGDEEATLGLDAALHDPAFADYPRLTIIDPGGNSTELMTASREGAVLFRKSYRVGALGLRDTTLKPESPGFAERLQAVAEIDDLIGMQYRPNEAGHAVVLGATGTNLVSIREKLLTWQPEKIHGAWLDYEEISKAVGWLFELTDSERAAVPGMEPGRERTIHIGALILERFLQCIHVLGCSVSVRGWRHALLEQGWPKS